jgi:hypothetical protein
MTKSFDISCHPEIGACQLSPAELGRAIFKGAQVVSIPS